MFIHSSRLYNYLCKLEILCDDQFGFRKNHSTSLALIDLYDKISLALDRNEHAVGVFLDLSKAFDTVDHNILHDKLEHYGIRGVALDWVRSYLSNRLQFVQFNGQCSSPQTICCGVPQGSILGPLFFLLYINDLRLLKTVSRGPFLERPGNLPGLESDFDIKVSRKVGRVLTSDEVHFVSLADNFSVQCTANKESLIKYRAGLIFGTVTAATVLVLFKMVA